MSFFIVELFVAKQDEVNQRDELRFGLTSEGELNDAVVLSILACTR
jgi:hypothetical protein